MYRPRTVYRGKEKTGRLATLIVAVIAALLLLAVWLFYDLQKYMVYDKDGARLVLPSERAAAGTLSADAARASGAAEAPVEAEVVIEWADWSDVPGTDAAGLNVLHARFVAAETLNGTLLTGFVTGGLGGFDALVLELKPQSGLLAYKSAVPMTDSFAVNGTLELQSYVEQLKAQGVYLAAQLSALPDAALAVRDAPIALKSAAGGVYTENGMSWLDPYNDGVRAYLSALMAELKGMGFDEVILDGLSLPEGGYAYSVAMAAAPDAETAVGSLALYLRGEADALELRLSGVAAAGANGQDYALFFKAFDRVAYADNTEDDALRAALEAALGAASGTRLVPIGAGYVPESESYIVA